jgi:hypothetical protein
MRQIFWVILIVCVVVFGAVWFANRSKTHAVNSGDVFVRQTGAPATAAPAPATPPATADAPAQGPQATDQTAQDQTAQATPADQAAAPPAAQAQAAAPPASDSIARNPPNGMIFAGTGKYQLYRQGDITWRLNTDTGQACVLFATDAEWRKARVYQRGCGGS